MRHVLLVEDDPNDALLTRRYLERWGQPLKVEVIDTVAAIEAYIADVTPASPQISLVLLDHMLPGGSGVDVLRMFRAHPILRTVPVVLLSGNSDGAIVQRAREAGANSCVLKPVDPTDFERTVTALAEFWLGTNLIVRPDDRATVL